MSDGAMNIVVLVDYDNDSVGTALAVAEALGPRLWGVRLDTSNTMVDRSLWPQMGRFDPRGVNPQLVWNVRNALDAPVTPPSRSSSRAASRPRRSAPSRRPACRSTRTASARR